MDISNKQKEAFALALLKTPDEPYKAALLVFPDDITLAMEASKALPSDAYVVEYIGAIPSDEIDAIGVPTKNDVIRSIWNRLAKVVDHETFFKGTKALEPWLLENGNNGGLGNTYNDNRSVILFKDHGTDEEWAKAAVEQQSKLVEHATGPS